MKKYIEPKVKVVSVNVEQVIALSAGIEGETGIALGKEDMYDDKEIFGW